MVLHLSIWTVRCSWQFVGGQCDRRGCSGLTPNYLDCLSGTVNSLLVVSVIGEGVVVLHLSIWTVMSSWQFVGGQCDMKGCSGLTPIYLDCLSGTVNSLIVVIMRKEGVVALHLPIDPLKINPVVEPLLIHESSTYRSLRQYCSLTTSICKMKPYMPRH